METKIAIMSIIVEQPDTVPAVNAHLHDYAEYILGRMGIPYRERKLCLISIAMDAPQDKISALAGKLGKLPGVSIKTALSGVKSHD